MGLAGDGQEQASCLTGELPLQAESRLLFFFSQRLLMPILLIELSAATLSAVSILLQLRNCT